MTTSRPTDTNVCRRIRTFLLVVLLIGGVQNFFDLVLTRRDNHDVTSTARRIMSNQASDPQAVWEQEHCWRTRIAGGRHKYKFLITGAGYSATGYFAKTLTEAGYSTGHEQFVPNMVGLSDWSMASRYHNSHTPFLFQHIFVLVRHPLKVIHSQAGTEWNFVLKSATHITADVAHDETLLPNAEEFQKLPIGFKALEWWIVYTLLAENIAECFIRTRDIGPDLFRHICQRAELTDCESTNWTQIVDKYTNWNSHNKDKSEEGYTTWLDLEQNVTTPTEGAILKHARLLCQKYFDSEEC